MSLRLVVSNAPTGDRQAQAAWERCEVAVCELNRSLGEICHETVGEPGTAAMLNQLADTLESAAVSMKAVEDREDARYSRSGAADRI